MKRILCVLLVLVVALSVCVFGANAAEAYEYTDKYGITYYYAFYEENGSTKALIGYCKYDKAAPFTLTFPSKLGGYPVGAIADECFRDHKMLEGVKLPDSLEYIGEEAFYGAPLKNVTIPKNVSYIGLNAFGDVESYNVASSNKYYKAVDGVLYTKDGKILLRYPRLSKTEEFAIPKGVEYIYDYAFNYAKNLTKVTFPESLIYIGSYAFCSTGLKSLHIGKNIEHICDHAFGYTEKLKKVTIDEDAYPYFEKDVFAESGLKSDSQGATYIGHLLYHLYNPYMDVKEVKIKEGTTAICVNAIEGISDKTITLPSTLVHIPMDAFYRVDFTGFSVHKDNPYFTSIDGALYTKDKKTLLIFPSKEEETYSLADSTEAIYTGAFNRHMKVKNLIVPESLNTLYDKAFLGADFLKLTFLGDAENVGYKVMTGWCYYLEELHLPEGSVMFGIEDFKETMWYFSESDGFFYADNALLGYKGKFYGTTLTIDQRFTSIGRRAFINFSNIDKLILPENLKGVGVLAFANCTRLKEVYIPADVDKIGMGAFGFKVTTNPDTGEITSLTKVEDFVIKGYTNSLAESYADANGFEFISVGYMEPESTLLGDIDCDGKLTVRDATALQKYVAGMVGLNTQDKINADFNEDGKINVRDATAIQKRIAKIS